MDRQQRAEKLVEPGLLASASMGRGASLQPGFFTFFSEAWVGKAVCRALEWAC